MKEFLQTLPKHNGELILSHNPHKSNYETVESWEEHSQARGWWISDDDRDAAIAAQDFWIIQWYPDTPVGFLAVCGHDLDLLLTVAGASEG